MGRKNSIAKDPVKLSYGIDSVQVGANPTPSEPGSLPAMQFLSQKSNQMTTQRRKPSGSVAKSEVEKKSSEISLDVPSEPPVPTGKIFLGEEDKRLLKKLNKHLVNKLGLGGNRSVKL